MAKRQDMVDFPRFMDMIQQLLISTKGGSKRHSVENKKTFTFYRVSNGASFGVDQQLLDRLNRSPYFHLKEADLNDCQIIFVFCIINTRIESDVEAAIEKIPESAGDKPVILVVMHHNRDINFETTKKEWEKKYERVQLDVEVLFHRSEGGLLRCEKNNQAVEEIRKKVEGKWREEGEGLRGE
ncbi:unnamed protein product [Menidia menidia]|uniref:(Atlantic silverside) hypothetical protein n=1 Tax=Menidia menidia TaxID=238744 RepID=A0A8S4BK74_9TELE|nr:unnamed protein product [Menidia menidia]